jgi:hypothetical protein
MVSDTVMKLSKGKLVRQPVVKAKKFKGLLVNALKFLVRLPSALYNVSAKSY